MLSETQVKVLSYILTCDGWSTLLNPVWVYSCTYLLCGSLWKAQAIASTTSGCNLRLYFNSYGLFYRKKASGFIKVYLVQAIFGYRLLVIIFMSHPIRVIYNHRSEHS